MHINIINNVISVFGDIYKINIIFSEKSVSYTMIFSVCQNQSFYIVHTPIDWIIGRWT